MRIPKFCIMFGLLATTYQVRFALEMLNSSGYFAFTSSHGAHATLSRINNILDLSITIILKTTTFVSVDWGTSRLRLCLAAHGTKGKTQKFESQDGIKHVNILFAQANGSRETFFLEFLYTKIQAQFPQLNASTPIVISGMASSTIGIKELPYARTPFSCEGEDTSFEKLAHSIFPNPTFIISGVASDRDVMRGEETQAIGLFDDIGRTEFILLLPGTHSKHLFISGNKMVDFHTYLTGELFEIISKYSILKNSIQKGTLNDAAIEALKRGADQGANMKLLNKLFEIRALEILGSQTSEFNYYFLSGLLLGNELANLKSHQKTPMFLAATDPLLTLYKAAAKQLGLPLDTLETVEMQDAIIRGQARILKSIGV